MNDPNIWFGLRIPGPDDEDREVRWATEDDYKAAWEREE